MKTALRIYVGSIVYREIRMPHYWSMLKLREFCTKNDIALEEGIVRGDALVSRSRSIAASAFLRSDADVMISIDADIEFNPIDAISLCQKALEYDIIGGLYMTRNLNTQPALMLPDHEVVFDSNASPVEVQYVSTGFLATTRRPFEALRETLPLCHQTWGETAFWPFYMPFVKEWPDDGFIYLSEDWAFVERARDVGFPCYLDPSIRLTHWGDHGYTLEDLVRPSKPSVAPLSLTRHSDGSLETKMLEGAMK